MSDATAEHLLHHLADVEHDVWARGGVDAHRRRRAAASAALAGGCGVSAVAAVLGVGVPDVLTWLREPETR